VVRCDHNLSSANHLSFVHEGEIYECLLREDHRGDHLTKVVNVAFRRERYIAWSTDDECGCPPEEGYCGCIVYQELTKKEADTILKKKGPSP